MLLASLMSDKVTRKAMVGHVTDDMTEHYSTVLGREAPSDGSSRGEAEARG
ncbi:MAG: hypothetical protein JWN44_2984 [Myxococcales bacterium]|nr:hypothetical protein [Myxococcales bacterium]